MAGGYLAVTEYGPDEPREVGTVIRVVRWPSLAPVYTLTGARVSTTFALTRKGTLVGTRIPEPGPAISPDGDPSPCLSTKLETVWLSPAEPIPHVVPGTPCDEEVSLHGDRVLRWRLVAPAFKGYAATDYALTKLRGGASRRLLADGTRNVPLASFGFAADGSVEVERNGCDNATRIDFFPLRRLLTGSLAPVRCRTRKAR